MVYTSFALLASALLISGAFVLNDDAGSESSATRITEASFFMDSVLQDMERSLSMGSRRAYTASANYVITNNEPLESPEDNVTSALVNASLGGEDLQNMENVSLESWTQRVSQIASDSSYSLEATVSDYGMNASGTSLKAYFRAEAVLKDPVSLARFNRTETARSTVSVSGIEDPMITLRSNSGYISNFRSCSFDEPAEELYTASTNSSGYAYGKAVVNPSDASDINSKLEKILVVDDVDIYQVSDVNQFAGVVSADSNSSSGYDNIYAFETGSISGIENNDTLLVDKGSVWGMRFAIMFRGGCYVPDPSGPDVLDRLENRVSNDDGGGIATLIDVSNLPSEVREEGSAVAYVYFSDDASSKEPIKGVSDEYTWFRLDQQHIDSWGVNPLVK